MKFINIFRKYKTHVFIFALFLLIASCVVQYSGALTTLAVFIAHSPLTPFIEEHIIHRRLNPETLVKNWGDLLQKTAEIAMQAALFLLFTVALFLLFMVREKWLPFFRTSGDRIKRFFTSAKLNVLERHLSNTFFLFLFCGFLGAAFFVLTFGAAVLDVTNTGWLMAAGGDLSQHYMGWRFFRESAWHFPVGLMDNIVYPFKESIIYTDSIPLFAVFFKVFSPLLPENFQYFGIFGLLVYFLQGGVAALVIQKLCKNSFFALTGSLFFILSPTMMQRIFNHTSLAAHFIILLCLYACITHNGERTLRRNITVWGGLFCAAVGIHPYFVPVVFVFMIACFVKDFWKTRRLRENIISGVASLAVLFVAMFILGAFYSGNDPSEGGLGYFSMNANSLFNSQETSRFMKALPLATGGQYEGYGYLGFGGLLGGFLIVCFTWYKTAAIKNVLKKNISYKRNAILTAALFLFFFMFALSPAITFNSKEIFRYYIPGVNRLWSVFRATGRYVWVLQYMIMCVMFWAVKKFFNSRKGLLILCVLLAVQYIDLKNYFSEKGEAFKQRTLWVSPLMSKEWTEIAANKKHIFFVQEPVHLSPLMDFALVYNLTTNDSYIARKNTQTVNRLKSEEKIRILAGCVDGQTIYVFETENEAEKYKNEMDISTVDGVIVGVKKSL
jgi:hypothetical protein